jgi:CRP/FNR family transcriptional regulator, anaerobic regulatory protein
MTNDSRTVRLQLDLGDSAPVQPARFNPQTQVCSDCGIRAFALFGALDLADIDRIHVRIADLSFAPGESLFCAEAPGQAVYTIRSGVVRLERSTATGARRITRLAGRADLIGLEAVLGQTYAAEAIACTPVTACRIPRGVVEALTADHPALTRDLMKRWQRALDDADEWLTELTRGSARHRMLRLLLKLSEFSSADGLIWLPSRQDMGAMLDMTFETASRLVSAARRDGLLEPVDARHARLAMPALLQALQDEQDAA